MKWLVGIIIVIIVVIAGWFIWTNSNSAGTPTTTTTATSTVPADTYGMTEYTDPTYGFTFWYPSGLTVTASTTNDSTSFPGGTQVERIQVGDLGGTYVAVVNSPQSTITDEPNGHASPIAQTKYFYNNGQWMVAYPEGSQTGGSSATTTATQSGTTIGNLPIFPSGARFDTSIIPLSTTQFLVMGDGGGSSFTSALAQTVAPAGATVDPTVEGSALQAESVAYGSSQ
jgi:hypothetical protein